MGVEVGLCVKLGVILLGVRIIFVGEEISVLFANGNGIAFIELRTPQPNAPTQRTKKPIKINPAITGNFLLDSGLLGLFFSTVSLSSFSASSCLAFSRAFCSAM